MDNIINTSCTKRMKTTPHLQKHEKSFQQAWLEDPLFKNWLLPDPDKNQSKARCKVCQTSLKAGKTELVRHAGSDKHVKLMNTFVKNKHIDNMFRKPDENYIKKVKVAELKLAAFFAAFNVAFHIIDALEPLLKEIFPDSKIAQGVTLKRTKCSEIIKNVLAKAETMKLVEVLQQKKFSILVDESTDIGDYKNLCVLTRYIDSGEIKTKLLELIRIDARNSSAEALYNTFKNCFIKYNIPISNVIGLACDNASVMVGKYNSFFSHLLTDAPGLVLLRCICHSSALVASKACAVLPRSCEEMMRGIYNYVSGSAKRCSQLQEIQDYFHLEKHTILKLSATRWLCMLNCVTRILDNWGALEAYFRIAAVEDGLKSADSILAELDNTYNKLYFKFLKYVLQLFNNFNALFQSRKVFIHVLYFESMNLLKQICKNYMDIAIVLEKDLDKINLTHPSYFLPLNQIYVGPECRELLETVPRDVKEGFLKIILKFYSVAAEELQKRLPSLLFKSFSFLEPNIALYECSDRNTLLLSALCDQFQHFIEIDKTQLDIEWRELPLKFSDEEKSKMKALQLDKMWMAIINTKTFNDELYFKNLSKLVQLVLTLPHSNAEAERIFSIVTDTKTKKRNRLGEKALNAVCVFRSALQADEVNLTEYEITDDHLKLHNSSMYSFIKNLTEL